MLVKLPFAIITQTQILYDQQTVKTKCYHLVYTIQKLTGFSCL